MLQHQRLINPEFQSSNVLDLCPQADEWVKHVRTLLSDFEYGDESTRQEIHQKILALRQEMADFALTPIQISFIDLPAYLELYEHVMHALQSLDLHIQFRHVAEEETSPTENVDNR